MEVYSGKLLDIAQKNVVLVFAANVGHVVGAVVVVPLGGSATAVLRVGVMRFDKCFEVVLRQILVRLDGAVLLYPLHHLRLVEEVGVIYLLQVELELTSGMVGTLQSELLSFYPTDKMSFFGEAIQKV